MNWSQAVLRFDYVEDHGEVEPEVVVEEANEGEKKNSGCICNVARASGTGSV